MEDVATIAYPGPHPHDRPRLDLLGPDLSGSAGDDWGQPLTDEELEALALAADPDAPLPDDAVPLDLDAPGRFALLPTWYMAPVVGRRLTKKRYRIAIAVLIGAFLIIDAFGLCATYGPISLA